MEENQDNYEVVYFPEQDYKPQWSESGSLLNPSWYYCLNHSDASHDIYDLKLNEYVLFGLATDMHENKWFGGFYYNPIPSDEREDVAHYYPVNHKINPCFDTQQEACIWALNVFFSMYDSINFQFKVFIYKSLLDYCIGNEWLMLVDGQVISEKIDEVYCLGMTKAKKQFEQRKLQMEKLEQEYEQAKRAFKSFM